MKTLVVFSAWATIALAAPSLLGFEDFKPEQESDLSENVREKKSPTFGEVSHLSPWERSAFRKPLIMKKKIGHHHLFRESEEEKSQIDVSSCSKANARVCEEARAAALSGTHNSETHVNERDMEQSIKMAKEAVENLQRDIEKMEHASTGKMAQWKHTESETDTEVHENIEAARQALDHIQQNFGNVEEFNMHSTVVEDDEVSHDNQFKMARSEEQRMAQWKEALENIQKNVELVRTIEDSFKNEENHSQKNIHQTSSTNQMRALETTDVQKDMIASVDSKKEKASESHDENEMKSSASTQTASKIKLNQDSHEKSLRNQGEDVHVNANLDILNHEQNQGLDQTIQANIPAPKARNSGLENSLGLKVNLELNGAESHLDTNINQQKMKGSENFEHIVTSQIDDRNEQHNLFQKSEEFNKSWKSSTHFNEKSSDFDVTNLNSMKAAEDFEKAQLNEKFSPNLSINTKTSGKAVETQHLNDQSTFQSQQINNNFQQNAGRSDIQMKAVDQDLAMKQQFLGKADSDFAKSVSLNLNSDLGQNNFIPFPQSQSMSPQASDVHESLIVKGKSSLIDNTLHINKKNEMEKDHLNRLVWNQHHGSARGAYGYGGLESGAASALSIGGGSLGGIGGAGGAGGSGGPGAVGIFPHASVSNCAIPLLLSCSPSVASGSLAKSHPSYAAPSYGAAPHSYRNNEEVSFHNKRDARKLSILKNKTNRTPIFVNSKPSI